MFFYDWLPSYLSTNENSLIPFPFFICFIPLLDNKFSLEARLKYLKAQDIYIIDASRL